MNNRFLRLDNPCSEKWEEMTPTSTGSYCDLCSKNVIDFTRLTEVEISRIIKKSGNSICARLTKAQLNAPLLDLERSFEFALPKVNVAAGLLLVTSLTIGQTLHAETHIVETEFVQSSDAIVPLALEERFFLPSQTKASSITVFKGKVTSKKSGKPVENAKITFVTSKKMITAFTSKEGTFSIEIPTGIIDNDNVIRVSYSDVVHDKNDEEMFFWYETTDYILSKEELTAEFLIEAKEALVYLGGVSSYSDKRKPIVLSSGREINYNDFVKAIIGEKSSCSLENKDYLYFESEFAVAIYGKKAKDGLYILTEKVEK